MRADSVRAFGSLPGHGELRRLADLRHFAYFSSSSARDDYLPHPAHAPVAHLISHLAEQVVVFDVDA
ncbi:hypothetical protein G5T42_04690 [Microbacterium sp. 4R-513]|nr:hypothetical protein G5T42_04690 [Microbacterium sp. 4R-513]